MPDYRLKLYRGSWYVVWTENGKTQRRSLRTESREEAERGLVDFKRNLTAPVGSTVGALVDAYLDYKRERVRSFERMELAWKVAKPTFGNLRPDQITPELCDEYIASRREIGRSDGTILKEINTIRQALNWNKITTARFEAPSAPPPRDRHLGRDEYMRLLDGCKQPHVRLFVVLALSTGGRKEALLSLTWDRVDFARGRVNLAIAGDKGRKGRATISMSDRLRRELEAAREAAQTPYVIEYAGKRVLNIKKGFAAAVARAGLNDVTPHDLRHTAAVWMAEDGVSFEEIAQFLGHASPTVTYRVYARFSPEHLKRAAKALEF